MRMKGELIKVLQTLGFPVYQQGSLSADERYPDTFFTFWNNSTEGASIYNNKVTSYIWDFDVNCYAIDADQVEKYLVKAIQLLEEHGFIIGDKGYDVMSDEQTHTGRGTNILYIEKKEREDK